MNEYHTATHRVSRIMQSVRISIVLIVLLVACTASPPAPKQDNISSAGQAAAPAAESQNDETTPPTGDDSSPPQEGDTLIFASDMNSIRSLDPAEAYEVESSLVVGNMYETLIQHNPDTMELQGILAKTWTIEERNNAWSIVFTLNEEATFASGNPVTAEDVVFSWRRVIELNRQPAFLFTDVAQLTPDNIQATGTHTVQVHIPTTINPQVFLSLLSFSFAAVVDSAVVQEHEADSADITWLHDHSAGSGPYMLERWDQNERIVLQENPYYWHEPPFIPTIVIRDIADSTDLHALISSGEADIVQDISSEQAQALKDTPDVAVVAVETLDLVYIGMNAGAGSPVANPDVREAVRYAINYNELKALLGDNAIVTQEIIPSGLLGRTGLRPFEHNPSTARELLDTAGLEEGTKIEFLVPTGSAPGGIEWSTLASKIAYDLEQVGLTINIVQTEQLLDIYRAAEHEMVMTLWSPDYPDPDANITPFTDYDTHSVGWRNQWNNPDITQLVREAAQEQDALNRIALYRVITERIQHEGPYAVLYQPSRLYALRDTIRGFRYTAAYSPAILFSLIEKE